MLLDLNILLHTHRILLYKIFNMKNLYTKFLGIMCLSYHSNPSISNVSVPKVSSVIINHQHILLMMSKSSPDHIFAKISSRLRRSPTKYILPRLSL